MAAHHSTNNPSFIQEELETLSKILTTKVEGSELICCHAAGVQVRITRTKYKSLIVHLQFPTNYPDTAILVEVKSKTLPHKLLIKLTELCDQECKKYLGRQQALLILKFVRKFIDENPLIVCSDELQYVKNTLIAETDQLKIKQKSGSLNVRINQNRYFMDFKALIPDNYPAEAVRLEEKESNFPDSLSRVFIAQACDMARQCVEPPLRRKPRDPPFEPKPSLKLVADFLVKECIKRYPLETCPVCGLRALPEHPKDIVTDANDEKFVERVYCTHLFHHGCMDNYMKTPPFTGGKKCPSCGNRIFHDKWKIPPRLAEARWAHKEAKNRELAEVEDFLKDCT